MSDAATIIATAGADHAAVAAKRGLPGLRAVRLATPEPERFTAREAIEQRLAELDARYDGWCRRESWYGRTPCAPMAASGPPLDGEFVSADGASSLRLLFAGGQWLLFTLAERQDGAPALREEAMIAGHRGPMLRYAVYWAGPEGDPAGLRRIACRLVGFGGAER